MGILYNVGVETMNYKIIESPKGCKINYAAIEAALNSVKVKPHILNKEIDKIIYIENKLINIVTKD